MRNRKFLLALLAVVLGLMIIVSIFAALGRGGSARKEADAFVASILDGDINTTYNLLASETKTTEARESWTEKVDRIVLYLGDGTPDRASDEPFESGGQKSYRATYNIKGADGDYTISMVMVEEKEGWRVLVFNTGLKQ